MKLKDLSLYLVILLISISTYVMAQATVYKTVLPNGDVTYSQTEEPGSEIVKVRTTPVSFKKATGSASSNTDNPAPNAKPIEYKINFISPKNEQVYISAEKEVVVNLQVAPALQDNDSVQLFIDDKPYGTLQSELDYTITNLDRGAHTLQAKIYADKGAGPTRGESGSITINVQRAFIHNN